MNRPLRRFARGCLSILGAVVHPLGRFSGPLLDDLRTAERLQRGLVLVLPGVEGESCLNHSIAPGWPTAASRRPSKSSISEDQCQSVFPLSEARVADVFPVGRQRRGGVMRGRRTAMPQVHVLAEVILAGLGVGQHLVRRPWQSTLPPRMT